ncbi:hypothetical protein I3842_08G111000 [Carya illinoinensis]|uniref:glucan endo-1,3-beta-D-glucosidase n=1 Tax=Carya illinoinensis TaxID=32201 RepID=A0A922EC88_CARIL|nr:hypothetical protein I3842_08G111000 [Carya illinoinensis]
MYTMRNIPFIAAMLLLLQLLCSLLNIDAQSIGLCYGGSTGNANNLPPESEAVNLCKTHGIGKMRIYSPYPEILQPLGDSNIELIVGVPKDTFQDLADPSAAADWVQKNVKDYSSEVKLKYIAVGNELDPTAQFVLLCDSFQRNKKSNSSNVKFKYIAVGNEIDPTDGAAQFVLPIMQNIYKAIADAGLQNQIKVSTAVSTNLLDVFDPPSAAAFSANAGPFMEPIIGFLVKTGAPLLANIYPYFRVKYNNQSLPYALFTATDVVVQDAS